MYTADVESRRTRCTREETLEILLQEGSDVEDDVLEEILDEGSDIANDHDDYNYSSCRGGEGGGE